MSPDRQTRTGGRGQSTPYRNRFSSRALVTAVLFLLLTASPAAAEPCALTDPGCITETLDETVDSAKDAITDAEETAGQVVEAVDEAATGVVERVTEVIDGLLGKGGKDPGGGGGGGGGGKGSPGQNGPGSEQSRGEGSLAARRLDPRDPSVDTVFRPGSGVPGGGPVADKGRPGGIGAAARQLAFPALLAILVLSFLVIQNRLDRQDPRLAAAPLGPDLLSFE